MFPFEVILIGRDDRTFQGVRRELTSVSASVRKEYPDMGAVFRDVRPGQNAPCLLIAVIESAGELPVLKRLSGSYLGWPIIALLNDGEKRETIYRTMRSGAGQVVPLPLDGPDLREALECISLQFAQPTGATPSIAVTGATGGCGATTLAINLAYEIAFLEDIHCILIELALQRGMLSAYLDLQPRFTTQDILDDPKHIDLHLIRQVLTKVTDKFEVLAGPDNAPRPLQVTSELLRNLIDLTRQSTGAVLLDVPCVYDDLHLDILSHADVVVLVGEQKVPSVRNLKMLHDLLIKEPGVRTIHVVLNRFDPNVQGFGADRLRDVLHVPEVSTIANDYATVMAAVNRGRPLRLLSEGSSALADIDRLVRTVRALDEPPASASRSGAMFTPLLRALGLK